MRCALVHGILILMGDRMDCIQKIAKLGRQAKSLTKMVQENIIFVLNML